MTHPNPTPPLPEPVSKVPVFKAVEKAEKFGRILSQSQIFGVKSVADATVLAITCIVENITPLDFVRKYHIIQGRPTMRADAMLAEFCRQGGRHRIVEYTEERCVIEFVWKGQKQEWTWTMADARRANLYGDNWKKYPKDMLFARCVSSALKKIAPELFHGFYTPEEIQDIQEEKTPSYNVSDYSRSNGSTMISEGKTPSERDSGESKSEKKSFQYSIKDRKDMEDRKDSIPEVTDSMGSGLQNKDSKDNIDRKTSSSYMTDELPCDYKRNGHFFPKGTKFVDIPRNILATLPDWFIKAALPIRLSIPERELFADAARKAYEIRDAEKKNDELENFRKKLEECTLADLEKLARNHRYGMEKKRMILRQFMTRIRKERIDTVSAGMYSELLESFGDEYYRGEDADLLVETLDYLKGVRISEEEEGKHDGDFYRKQCEKILATDPDTSERREELSILIHALRKDILSLERSEKSDWLEFLDQFPEKDFWVEDLELLENLKDRLVDLSRPPFTYHVDASSGKGGE